jgi:hypothetical protein
LPTDSEFVATKTKVLFNISGTKAAPVKGVTIRGLTMRDTRITYVASPNADVASLNCSVKPKRGWFCIMGSESLRIVAGMPLLSKEGMLVLT